MKTLKPLSKLLRYDEIDPETHEIITVDELGQLSPGQRAAVIRRQQEKFDENGEDGQPSLIDMLKPQLAEYGIVRGTDQD